jgi:cobaltochelatase CobT
MSSLSAITPVSIIRQSISAVTQILAGRSIRVYQRGLEACVEYDERTGEAHSVTLPYLPDDASEELIFAVQGFLDHEVGHLLFTDNRAIMDIGHDKEWLMMQNYLEDPFVEIGMQKKFSGSKTTIARLHDFFLSKTIDPAYKELDGDSSPLHYFGVLLPCITRAWHGMPKFEEYMRDKWEHVKPITSKLPSDIADQVKGAKNTYDNVRMARELIDAIMYVPPSEEFGESSEGDSHKAPSLPSGKGKKDETTCSGFEDESGSSSSSRRPLIDEECDEDIPSIHPGEREDEAPDLEGHDEDESEDEDEEGLETAPEPEPAPMPDEPYLEDEEFEDEGGDDDYEDDDSKGSGGGDDIEDLDDVPGSEEFDDESEGSGGGRGVGEDDGDSEDLDRELGKDRRMGRDESLEEKDGGESEEGESEGEPEEEGEPEGEPEGEKSEVWTPGEEEGLMDYAPGSVEDILGREIAGMAAEAAKDADYVIYSTDFDKIEPFTCSRMEEKAESGMKRLRALTESQIGTMQNALQRALISKNKSFWRTGQHSGRINSSSLARLTVGDPRVFRRLEETRSKNYDVTLLIDCSGSMSSSTSGSMTRFSTAMVAAFGLGETLSRVGVNFEILGFTTKPHSSAWTSECKKASAKYDVRFGRIDWIYMPVFKSFDERWTPTTMGRLAAAFADASFLRENVDGECVQIAAQRLLAQKSEGKLLIVLSDGAPACNTSDYTSLRTHLRRSVQSVQRAGVKVVGIGIDTNVVKSFYDEHIVLNDVRKLPTEVVDQLQRVLLS